MLKYLFDRLAALLGLILLSPVLVIVAIIVMVQFRTCNPFFTQQRVGLHGKLFTIFKFRTMEHGSTSSVAVSSDIRISKLSYFMRTHKLDELPELWNVLIADMSFVGPRPDVPGYADKLEGEDKLILNLRPGITGPASLKYANEDDILATKNDPKKYNDEVIYPDKVRINLEYYHKQTFFGDLKIIFQSIFHCFQ